MSQDASGAFLKAGYNAAVKAKKDRESKGKAGTGGKGVRDRVGPAQVSPSCDATLI